MKVTWEKIEATKCKKCKKKLTNFKAYIPNLGEVCMNCYVAYAKKTNRREK